MQPPDDDDDDAAMSGMPATSPHPSSIPPTTLGNHQESDKFIDVVGKKEKIHPKKRKPRPRTHHPLQIPTSNTSHNFPFKQRQYQRSNSSKTIR